MKWIIFASIIAGNSLSSSIHEPIVHTEINIKAIKQKIVFKRSTNERNQRAGTTNSKSR